VHSTSSVYSPCDDDRTETGWKRRAGSGCNFFVTAAKAFNEFEDEPDDSLAVSQGIAQHSADRLTLLKNIIRTGAASPEDITADTYSYLTWFEPAREAADSLVEYYFGGRSFEELVDQYKGLELTALYGRRAVLPAPITPPVSTPIERPKGPVVGYFALAERNEELRNQCQLLIDQRLRDLRGEASDEGLTINVASERALREFMSFVRPLRRPAIALLDNGNLRAQWRDAHGAQVSIQFRQANDLQFVFLSFRQGGSMASSAGRDSFKGILVRLRAEDLWGLVVDDGRPTSG
jgi:hypothetical protein